MPALDHVVRDVPGSRRSTDLVELAVRILEDDPRLNAGFGAVLNVMGELELDAGIVDGATGRVAGVANVTVRHPISLARLVMETTPHVLVTGRGAEDLGTAMEHLSSSTPEQHEKWEAARRAGKLDPSRYGAPEFVDTVGAVALDDHGNLAAGSSTGGVFGKLRGRVGDAPIFGAGIYADHKVAVVGSGVGELFLINLACARVAREVERGASPQEACEDVVAFLGTREKTSAALLALDRNGDSGAAYRGGSWSVAGPQGVIEAVRLA
ncbi:MAG: L-asparaginase / beta-aspartyl-peptidase [Actinomycetota bacterium]|nr:L-asparaginase / beta-aspartyl-peptidase [Actinomycetota bacterium]